MHRHSLGTFLSAPVIFFALLLVSSPASADSVDQTPPTIGIVSPDRFAVNHLTSIKTTVSSDHGLNGCFLYINGTKIDRMTVRDGFASIDQVFFTPETREINVRCEDGTGLVGIGPTTAMRADRPDDPQPGTLPLGFSAGMLVHVTCLPGDWISEHCEQIYSVGKDAKRHAYQSQAAFKSWNPTNPTGMSISLEALSSLPLGSPISAKPGSSAVRFLSQPMIYAVSASLQLRRFANDDVKKAALGSDWPSRIDVLTDAFYGNFTFGEELKNADEIVMR